MPVDMTEHATYHTDRVTVRMLARMPERIDDICGALRHDTAFMAVIGADKVPGEPLIELVQFHAWARKRVICDMRIVGGHRFADAAYKAPSALPETLLAAAAGRPCRDVLDHPALDDVLWDVEQNGEGDMLHADLNSDIDLGHRPGARLRELALAERRRLDDGGRT
jgi:hypothetical protein